MGRGPLPDSRYIRQEIFEPIGAEVYRYYVDGVTGARSENKLDHYLGICVPEPATMLLVGGGLLLLVTRRAGKRSRGSD